VKRQEKIQAKAGAVTEAEGGLFSHVGEGPSPTRQDEDRPAQDSADEETERKMGFEANAKEIRDAFKMAALVYVRRFSVLRRFVRAGRKIVARLLRAGLDSLPDRPTRGSGRNPPNRPRPQ
jgi:hypothetical protein